MSYIFENSIQIYSQYTRFRLSNHITKHETLIEVKMQQANKVTYILVELFY